MVEALFHALFNLFMTLVSFVSSIFIYPIQVVLVTLNPGLGQYLAQITGFFNQRVFPFMSFLINWFLNVTKMPEGVYILIISTFFGILGIATSLRIYLFIIRIYALVRGNVQFFIRDNLHK